MSDRKDECWRCGRPEDGHAEPGHDFQPGPGDDRDEPDERDFDPDYTGRCHWCGGDGWVECDDPIQCTSPHNRWGECPCSSCGGSGKAEDMTIW